MIDNFSFCKLQANIAKSSCVLKVTASMSLTEMLTRC